jgi:hypothetical protein
MFTYIISINIKKQSYFILTAAHKDNKVADSLKTEIQYPTFLFVINTIIIVTKRPY